MAIVVQKTDTNFVPIFHTHHFRLRKPAMQVSVLLSCLWAILIPSYKCYCIKEVKRCETIACSCNFLNMVNHFEIKGTIIGRPYKQFKTLKLIWYKEKPLLRLTGEVLLPYEMNQGINKNCHRFQTGLIAPVVCYPPSII